MRLYSFIAALSRRSRNFTLWRYIGKPPFGGRRYTGGGRGGLMNDRKDDGKPNGVQKRRVYLLFGSIALVIESMLALTRGEAYRPTLLGSAILIASILFFTYSWFRER